ncbi:MAG: hypothetical protein ABI614_03115 [Planctomycetota bacterium]
MINRTYDGTLSPDGQVVLDGGELPDRKMRVLVTVLGPLANVCNEGTPMTFESYLRTMPDTGTDAEFSRIRGEMRDIDLAD